MKKDEIMERIIEQMMTVYALKGYDGLALLLEEIDKAPISNKPLWRDIVTDYFDQQHNASIQATKAATV